MFVIEKIGGVSGVKRPAFKSRKWAERAAGPFPSIPDHLDGSERAGRVLVRLNRYRLPPVKTAITLSGLAERRPLKLRFSRQHLVSPSSVCGRLGMADINRPRFRHRDLAEHRVIPPDRKSV